MALASFSFFSTTLPHHYQESTAQKEQQSRGKPPVFLESDAVIEVGLLDAGFFLGCWGGKIQSFPLSCSDRSRLVLSKTRCAILFPLSVWLCHPFRDRASF